MSSSNNQKYNVLVIYSNGSTCKAKIFAVAEDVKNAFDQMHGLFFDRRPIHSVSDIEVALYHSLESAFMESHEVNNLKINDPPLIQRAEDLADEWMRAVGVDVNQLDEQPHLDGCYFIGWND